MNLKKCSKGHYYDGDAYTNCPHCKNQNAAENSTVALDVPPAGTDDIPTVMMTDNGPTLSSVIQTVTENREGTVPTDNQKTVSYFPDSPILAEKTPVAGWVVCIKGKMYGQDFRLKSGRNFVGRDENMDICLRGESTISRDRHAILIYEPKQNVFLAQPGETKELFYLNGTVVLTPTVMKKNDILQIGNVSLMLIPCCDESFRWGDEEKPEVL